MVDFRLFVLLVLAFMLPLRADGQALGAPETVMVQSGALALRGLLWRPSGQGPFPAVLFTHGSGPVRDLNNATILGAAFSHRGYAFLYLFRRGAGLSEGQGTNSGALLARALAEGGQDARNELQLELQEIELSDAVAALAFLRGRREVDPHRIAIGGHSGGGQITLLLAERDKGVRAAVVFAPAAGSWERSLKLRERLLAAVGRSHAPVFFIYAENDFSVAPGLALAAEMKRLGKLHHVKIYPPVGKTASDGHDFVHLGVSTWEPDVFAFLDERMRP